MPQPRPTLQLCSAPKDPGNPKTPRCTLPLGHLGPHEAFTGEGQRVKFESPEKP